MGGLQLGGVVLAGLDADDLQQSLPHLAKPFDALRPFAGEGLREQLVFLTVENLIIPHHKGVIPRPLRRVLIDDFNFFGFRLLIGRVRLGGEVCLQASDGAVKRGVEVVAVRGDAGGGILPAVPIGAALHFAQHHFRMRLIIIVVANPAVCLVRLRADPIKFRGIRHGDKALPLFQKNQVCGDFGSRQRLERCVRQADGSNQLRTFSDIPPHAVIHLIHRPLTGDKGQDAARFQEVQGLPKIVVVNIPFRFFFIFFIAYLDAVEGDVAQNHVKAPRLKPGALITRHGDGCFRVELLGDAAGDGINLHTVQLCPPQALRQNGIKIARSHAGVEHLSVGAALKAEIAQGGINPLDKLRLGVVGGQGGVERVAVLHIVQQQLQLPVFFFPPGRFLGKGVCDTAPADVAGQDDLLLLGCRAALLFDPF